MPNVIKSCEIEESRKAIFWNFDRTPKKNGGVYKVLRGKENVIKSAYYIKSPSSGPPLLLIKIR